jgi:predicted transcriptional regulator
MRNAVRMAMRTATNLSLPPDLIAEVDDLAGPRGRSAFVEDAIRTKVKREKLRRAFEAVRGIMTAEEYPEFATSEQVVEWVRERRREVTHVVPGTEWANRHK